GECLRAWRRHECRPVARRYRSPCALSGANPEPHHHGIRARDHSQHVHRSVRRRQRSASPVYLGAMRFWPERNGAGRQATHRSDRNGCADVVGIVMRAAPIGAFGAIAFTVGKFGAGSLLSLGKLLISFYVTCLIFIVAVLWPIAHVTGVSL